jgi:hypothetical protein
MRIQISRWDPGIEIKRIQADLNPDPGPTLKSLKSWILMDIRVNAGVGKKTYRFERQEGRLIYKI